MRPAMQRARKRLLVCAAGAGVLLAGAAAFACGAAFGPSITVDPHQDIIVAWKDNVETYVFQPVFCGTTTDFGLIMPVPSTLSQKPSLTDQQAFTAAAALSEPTKRQVVQKNGGIACAGGSAGGMKTGAVDTPTVVASGQVGFLDWAELKADTEASFTDWLAANGYPYSSTSAGVFSYYVQKGWYFVAFRISQEAAPDGGTICRALGPVALSFPTPVPVVPSRMASAGNGSSVASQRFSWRLFGITHGDAQLAFSETTNSNNVLMYSGAIKDGDVASFSGLAEAGDRLTRLTLSFSGGSSDPDIGLTLAAPADYRGTEDVYVYDDSACSVSQSDRLPHSLLLTLSGLALFGLACWR
ncbi:MAG TPA: DUF2330 domain-containing protein, partial [Polyangia bacterium]